MNLISIQFLCSSFFCIHIADHHHGGCLISFSIRVDWAARSSIHSRDNDACGSRVGSPDEKSYLPVSGAQADNNTDCGSGQGSLKQLPVLTLWPDSLAPVVTSRTGSGLSPGFLHGFNHQLLLSNRLLLLFVFHLQRSDLTYLLRCRPMLKALFHLLQLATRGVLGGRLLVILCQCPGYPRAGGLFDGRDLVCGGKLPFTHIKITVF